MKAFLVALMLAAAAAVSALPTKSKLSQEELRASLITKDNVAEYLQSQRHKKAMQQQKVPEPFVISTSLNVGRPARQSRTYFDDDGTAVIEGVRMPDDPVKDKVTWRNGRVINNVFVPDEAMVPEPVNVRQQPSQLPRQPKQFDFDDFYKGREPKRRMRDNMAIESRSDQVYVKPPAGFTPTQPEARDYKYHAGSTEEGRPVYYVVEEPDSLHSDRSPYDFEPADTHTSLSSQVADYTQSGYTQKNSGDFVIKEHSYTMCPGCPTFSIPVPIPKTSLGGSETKVNYQHARNATFLEKIGHRIVNGFQKVQDTVLGVFDPILETGGNFLGLEDDNNEIEEKIDRPEATGSPKQSKFSPMVIASLGAMAIGGMALISSAGPALQYLSQQSRQSRAMKVSRSDEAYEQLQKSMTKYE